ncbi:MAG: 30S ribosomal protein S7 [Candidatus Gracilibacteria bacterium]|nr:30S ribosomal protein S7 [Candidatus Gracilibacteria bacterium]MDD5178839.1 30S ribosomal protein S7 [Candidatus Gracilibacteria bacterium]
MKRTYHNGIPFKAQLLSGADPLQEKFINSIMLGGKKSVARNIFAEMLAELVKRGEKDPMITFKTALENAAPSIEVKPKRVGGGVYQVPTEVSPNRQRILSMRWILEAARKAKGKKMALRLADIILDSFKGEGAAVKKKEDVHKMAAANKAFAHLAKY